jgi:hypothetical protein
MKFLNKKINTSDIIIVILIIILLILIIVFLNKKRNIKSFNIHSNVLSDPQSNVLSDLQSNPLSDRSKSLIELFNNQNNFVLYSKINDINKYLIYTNTKKTNKINFSFTDNIIKATKFSLDTSLNNSDSLLSNALLFKDNEPTLYHFPYSSVNSNKSNEKVFGQYYYNNNNIYYIISHHLTNNPDKAIYLGYNNNKFLLSKYKYNLLTIYKQNLNES